MGYFHFCCLPLYFLGLLIKGLRLLDINLNCTFEWVIIRASVFGALFFISTNLMLIETTFAESAVWEVSTLEISNLNRKVASNE